MDKITLNKYRAFMYTTLLPRQWFNNLFPNTSKINTGRKNTRLESIFYAMPRYVANLTAEQRKAVNADTVASAKKISAIQAAFTYAFFEAKITQLYAQIKTWYLDHTDMTFDANVKLSMAKTLYAIAEKKDCISDLTLEQQEQIDRVFARELAHTIAAGICTVLKEILTFVLLAPVYYLIARPIYWLVYKNIALGNDATCKEQETMQYVKENTFSDYWKYGIVLPVYRFFHKIVIGSFFELVYGLACFIQEKEIAKKLPEMFNSGIDTSSEAIGSSKTIEDSDNSLTAKRPLLIAFDGFNSSMRGMLFTSKTMLFHRQASSNSTEASPTALKRKSAFEFAMDGDSPRPHSISL